MQYLYFFINSEKKSDIGKEIKSFSFRSVLFKFELEVRIRVTN